MTGALKDYLPLFKLRICSLIAFSAVAGFLSSSSKATLPNIFLLVLTTILSAAGSSAFNHYFDMDIDSRMTRTSGRPLASGRVVDSTGVLFIAAALVILSVVISLIALNYMVALHLFLGAFVYSVVYTVWLKRRSALNIVVGGLAGSFAVLAGGVSESPEMCMPPVLLSVVMFFWTPSHFWSFAIVHREEYARAGVPMLPVVTGDERAAWYILINTVLLTASSVLPYILGHFGHLYAAAAVGLGAYFLYMNIRLISSPTAQIARGNFRASMVYLGGLLSAVMIDALMR